MPPLRRVRAIPHTLITCLLILGGGLPAVAGALDSVWVEKWQEDLAFAHEALKEKHPSPFDNIPAEEMRAEFDHLTERLPQMDHRQVIVELARIVARIEDGHTRLTLPLAPGVDFMQGHSETERPTLPEMEFHQFPLRFGIDAKGVWVQSTSRALEGLLGGRLIAIDSRSAGEAVDLVSPTIQRDNPMQVLHHLPMHLVLAELFHATDVTRSADRAILTIERRDGFTEEVALSPVPGQATVDWVEAGPVDADSLPLTRQRNEENFWFTHLESRGLVYLQFNTVHDKDEETIRAFSEKLLAVLEASPDAVLVIDLRHNRGGNQSLGLPLLHAVIASPQNRAGQLFTIIGRTTFSAAMTFSLLMEKHTQTLFVGEPTGSRPNHYGDSRKTLLPNSNVTLRISSLYWQWSPRDDRPWIVPHAEAPPRLEADLAGEDPAMALIASTTGAAGSSAGNANSLADLSGEWHGNLPPASYGTDSVLRLKSDSGSLQAIVDIPQFGLEAAAQGSPAIEANSIAFQVSIGPETITYSGRMVGPWIVGQGDLGSVRFPILLKKSGT